MALPTASIIQGDGSSKTVNTLNSGRQAATDSASFALSNEDYAALGAPGDAAWASGNGSLVALLKAIAANAVSTTPSPVEVGPFANVLIAASSTTVVLGATGAVGDYLSHIHIQPATVAPGIVTLFDGTTTTKYAYPGSSSYNTGLPPITLNFSAKCVNAGWHITTGANVSVTAVGTFT